MKTTNSSELFSCQPFYLSEKKNKVILTPVVKKLVTQNRGAILSKDLDEVTRLLNLYIEGAGKGNADKLNEAFHASARWFGTMGGVDYDVDKAGFVALMVESPADGGELKAEITDIRIDGTVAMATVKEENFWGTLSFTDYFTLSILDGKWQITNKTFAHTGGEHA
jgi:hypothetical protein